MLFLPVFSQAQTGQKVLIFTGGKKIDRTNFFKIFDDLTIDYKELVQPEANDIYNSAEIDSFDVLVYYDMVQAINTAQKRAFIKMLKKGKGLFFLHHSLVSYQEWKEYEKIIGGRYYQSKNSRDSSRFEQSTFRHNVDIPVKIVDKNHPVTKDMNDFMIHDEVYGKYKILKGVNPIITTTHPESEEIIGWTNKYKNSYIVYLQPGHGKQAFDNPNYRLLIKRTIDWLFKNQKNNFIK